jgi:threonine synthase
MNAWPGVIESYRDHLPVGPSDCVVTLLEGNTPLIPAHALARRIGRGCRVFLKHEGLNPTASFKDRGMTVAITRALNDGAKAVICASTGNTSASAAAYAVRSGLRCIVVIPEGKIARGKLAQAIIHGARTIAVDGNFDQALHVVRGLSESYPVTLVNSVNPHRIQGQKTAAFEICDALGGRAPDLHMLPVGNAGNITATWLGYREYREAGRIASTPVVSGAQAAGAAPIVHGHPIERPETLATAIRIGNPASWEGAVDARDRSGGWIEDVTDDDILEAYRFLADREGVFAEPASAASVAGLLKSCENPPDGVEPGSRVADDSTIVCTLTGHGLKDPELAVEQGGDFVRGVAPDPDSVARAAEIA